MNRPPFPPTPGMQPRMHEVISDEKKKEIGALLRQLVFPIPIAGMQGLGITKIDLFAAMIMSQKMQAITRTMSKSDNEAQIQNAAAESVQAADVLFNALVNFHEAKAVAEKFDAK